MPPLLDYEAIKPTFLAIVSKAFTAVHRAAVVVSAPTCACVAAWATGVLL